jgi:hypothetical protein
MRVGEIYETKCDIACANPSESKIKDRKKTIIIVNDYHVYTRLRDGEIEKRINNT